MPMIPTAIYQLYEEKLIARYTLISRANERLKEARARAYTVNGMRMDLSGGSPGGGAGDALERKAIGVAEAERALVDALHWDDVIHRLDRLYPPGSRPGTVAGYLYGWTTGNRLTQEDIGRVLALERKAVRKDRDTYVVNCALLAAAAGLINMTEEETE